MCSRLLSLQAIRKLARLALVVLLLVFGSAYALLGDELFYRIGARIDRAGHRIADATTAARLRAAGSSLDCSSESFDQLLRYRDTLNQQIGAVQEQKEFAAGRLRADKRLLRNIVDVLEGNAVTSNVDLPRTVVKQDVASVLGRVEAHQSEVDKCNSLLGRMNEDLVKLEQEIEKTYCSLRRRSDDLAREKATFAGQKAYRDGSDLARELGDGDR